MRPLTVRNVVRWRPLLRFLFPWESCGGGKSGFRRIHFSLQGRLEGGFDKFLPDLANLFFAAGNPTPIGRAIDCCYDLLSKFRSSLLDRKSTRLNSSH